MHYLLPRSHSPDWLGLLALEPLPPGATPARNGMWPTSLRYMLAKLADVLFASELQRRVDADTTTAEGGTSSSGRGIISVSVHPGAIYTNMAVSGTPAPMRWFAPMIYKSPKLGAVTSLFAATAKEVREEAGKYKGSYLVPYGKIGRKHPRARDAEQGRVLWELTQRAVDEYLAKKGKDGE
jgi:hypothetical protein